MRIIIFFRKLFTTDNVFVPKKCFRCDEKTETFLQQEKHKLIQMEKFAVEKKKRTSIYRSILQQKPTFYHLNSLKRSAENNENINFAQNTRSYILNGF